MKIQLVHPTGGFEIKGPSTLAILSLIAAPPWVATTYDAWRENDGQGDFVLHFAPGCTVMIPAEEEPQLSKESQDIFRKAELFSDYHKDFYGYRPSSIAGKSPRELAAHYDLIAAEHQRMLQTVEGRAKLRANGWVVPDEEAPRPKKAPAKKVARRSPE